MKFNRLSAPKAMALVAAILMVIVGLMLSRVTASRDAADEGSIRGKMVVPPVTLESEAKSEPGMDAQEAASSVLVEENEDDGPTQFNSDEPKGVVSPSPVAVRDMAKPTTPVTQPRKATSGSRTLPPLPPPEWAAPAGGEEPSGPPPGVLWLSGVIQGDPMVALLRRGENRFLVRKGDMFEGYEVLDISSNSVMLQRGGRTTKLRLGQY